MAANTNTPSRGGSTLDGAGCEETQARRWYFNQLYKLFQQAQYKTNHSFEDAATVSFANADVNLPLLTDMLSEIKFAPEGAGWQEPWTDRASDSKKQKLTLRVQVDDEQGSGIRHIALPVYCGGTGTRLGAVDAGPAATHSGLDTAKTEIRPLTKAKLGNHISKALSGSKAFMDYCGRKGFNFERLALCSLDQVSTGSWQPTLYFKVEDPAPPSAILDAGLARLRGEGHSIHQSAT